LWQAGAGDGIDAPIDSRVSWRLLDVSVDATLTARAFLPFVSAFREICHDAAA